MQTLSDLLTNELQELLASERHSLQAHTEMASYATSPCFKEALTQCEAQTRTHIMRLQCAFDALSYLPEEKPCKALRHLIDTAMSGIETISDPAVRDAFMVGIQQKMEHLEIASYCCARDYALNLGHDEVADLLCETISEKQKLDSHLAVLVQAPPMPLMPTRHSVGC